MKLEEKRRHIEQEKRKMEFALSKQQQKVGKAAFLQAINKVSGLCANFSVGDSFCALIQKKNNFFLFILSILFTIHQQIFFCRTYLFFRPFRVKVLWIKCRDVARVQGVHVNFGFIFWNVVV